MPTPSPRRFMFVLWEGGGNAPMQLELARRMARRGHDVRVLTEDCLADDVRSAGCRFEPFVDAPNRASRSEDLVRDWEARTPLGAFARARDRVIMGPAAAYARDTRAALEREPVDVLVSDYMLFGVPAAAEGAVAARVAYAGAGVRLRPSATPGAIRAAVERVLGDPRFVAAARQVGARMAADAGADMATAELEALASGAATPRG